MCCRGEKKVLFIESSHNQYRYNKTFFSHLFILFFFHSPPLLLSFKQYPFFFPSLSPPSFPLPLSLSLYFLLKLYIPFNLYIPLLLYTKNIMSDSTPPLSSDDSKKRTRVTPSQLTILEETFSVSATPDSKMRKQLAFKLQMPERSIQIWFQNRRAKVKMLQRRVLLRQEQEAARARLCAEATSHQGTYWYTQQQLVQQQQQTQQQQLQQQFHMNRHLHSAKLPIHRAWSTDMIIPPPPPPPHMFHYHQQQQHQHQHHQQQSEPPSISITGPNELEEDIYSLTISPSPTPQSFGVVPRRMGL